MENLKDNITIGILREEGDDWERRVPLSPTDCKILIDLNFQIILQPSEIRCFTDDEYSNIGCKINNNLSDCSLILGIQTPDSSRLIKNKTFVFFAKAKKGKMSHEVLDTIINNNIRLFEYDGIKANKKQEKTSKGIIPSTEKSRVISFGKIAGMAATANIFKGISELLLSRRFSTPFLFSKFSYMYSDIEHLKQSYVEMGKFITKQYLPKEICPFVVCILGNGQAASGCIDLLKNLPHEFISPKNLVDLHSNKEKIICQDKIYICIFDYKHIYSKKDELIIKDETEFFNKNIEVDLFDKHDFKENPEKYISIFKYYIQYVSCIINCLHWEQSYKRLIKKSHLTYAYAHHCPQLLAIADVACDLNGSIEIVDNYTTFQNPFLVYEPILGTKVSKVDDATKEGILFMAIPKQASSLAEDASNYFSNLFFKYVVVLANSQYPTKEKLPSDFFTITELKDALVAENGHLSTKYKHFFEYDEKKLYHEKSNIENSNLRYFISLKLRGHIFDNNVFNKIINECGSYQVSTKINYMKIEETGDEISIIYIDLFSPYKDSLLSLMSYIDLDFKKFQILKDIVRTNVELEKL